MKELESRNRERTKEGRKQKISTFIFSRLRGHPLLLDSSTTGEIQQSQARYKERSPLPLSLRIPPEKEELIGKKGRAARGRGDEVSNQAGNQEIRYGGGVVGGQVQRCAGMAAGERQASWTHRPDVSQGQ